MGTGPTTIPTSRSATDARPITKVRSSCCQPSRTRRRKPTTRASTRATCPAASPTCVSSRQRMLRKDLCPMINEQQHRGELLVRRPQCAQCAQSCPLCPCGCCAMHSRDQDLRCLHVRQHGPCCGLASHSHTYTS